MCGIAGLARPDGIRERDAHLAVAMRDALHHRGPDDRGLWRGTDVVLAHTRLSILDRIGGTQPIVTADGRHVLVYNGELYNHRDLAKRLREDGTEPRTKCDSEVVLLELAQRGIAALEGFEGMFAFAWFDTVQRKLVLARDRLGIKPLYWVRHDGGVRFASEAPALFRDPDLTPQPDPVGLSAFFSYRQALGDRSLLRDVSQVEAGTHLTFDLARRSLEPTRRRYWSLEVPDEQETAPSIVQAAEDVAAAFEDSIRQRMMSDVPIGAYLSGGLDSSLVVATMSRLTDEPVRTFTVGFHDDPAAEFAQAREVAAHCRSRHTEVELDQNRFLEKLGPAIAATGGPLGVPNEVPLFELSFAMKQVFSVVLSGEGADELFGGYGRIFRSATDSLLLRDLARHPELSNDATIAGFVTAAKRHYGDPLPADHVEFFLRKYRYMPAATKHLLLSRDFLGSTPDESRVDAPIRQTFDRVAHLHPVRQFMHVFQVHHLQGLLRRLDRMTMAAGLEARVPFCDHRLVESVSRLPWQYKMRFRSAAHERAAAGKLADKVSERYDTTKWILRKALGHLVPESIVQRRKVGFPVPLADWFRQAGPMRDFVLDTLGAASTRERGVFDPTAIAGLREQITRGASATVARHAFYVCVTELWLRQLTPSASATS